MNKKTIKKRVREMLKMAQRDLDRTVDQALASGALTEEMKEDNYLLPKMLITIYFNKKPFEPLDERNRRDMNNLAKFI